MMRRKITQIEKEMAQKKADDYVKLEKRVETLEKQMSEVLELVKKTRKPKSENEVNKK